MVEDKNGVQVVLDPETVVISETLPEEVESRNLPNPGPTEG